MEALDAESDDLFHMEKVCQYVSLPPASLASPLPALCASVFSPLLLSYYPPAKGIVLAYQNVRLSDSPPACALPARSDQEKRHKQRREALDSEDAAIDGDQKEGQRLLVRCVDEYSAPFLWATAEILVWRPYRGARISARVTHQSSTHITLLCLNSFSISILRQHLPLDWNWAVTSNSQHSGAYGLHETTEGYWRDSNGMPVEDTQIIRIRNWEARSGKGEGRGGITVVKIEGSLLTEEEEKANAETAKMNAKTVRQEKRKKSALKQINGLTNGAMVGEAIAVE